MQPQLSLISTNLDAAKAPANRFSPGSEPHGGAHPFRAQLKSLQEGGSTLPADLAGVSSSEAFSSEGAENGAENATAKLVLTPPDQPEIASENPDISAVFEGNGAPVIAISPEAKITSYQAKKPVEDGQIPPSATAPKTAEAKIILTPPEAPITAKEIADPKTMPKIMPEARTEPTVTAGIGPADRPVSPARISSNSPVILAQKLVPNPAAPAQQSGKPLPDGKMSPANNRTLPQQAGEATAKSEISVSLPKGDETNASGKAKTEASASLLVRKGHAQKARGNRGTALQNSATLTKAATAADGATQTDKNGPTDKGLTLNPSQTVAPISAAKNRAAGPAEAASDLASSFFPKAGLKHDARAGERVVLSDDRTAPDGETPMGKPAQRLSPLAHNFAAKSQTSKPKGDAKVASAQSATADRQIVNPIENSPNAHSERLAQILPAAKSATPTPAIQSAELVDPALKSGVQPAASFFPASINGAPSDLSGIAGQSGSPSNQAVSQDLESLVEKLSAARILARADKGSLALNHPDFGKVTVEFSNGANRSLGVDMPDAPAELRQAVAQNFAQNNAGNNAAGSGASGGSRADVPRGDMGQSRSDQASSGRSESGEGQSAASENSRGSAGNNTREHAQNYGGQARPSNSTSSNSTGIDDVQALTTDGESGLQSARGAWA